MHRLDYSTRTEEHEETVITTDENGEEITDTITVAETILEFEVTHKPQPKWLWLMALPQGRTNSSPC